jgi:pSer/pThr/pTyr-binding forkhead associated (FHA) protein
MAKLVILNQGMTGRTFELKAEHTTVGRVEDNIFQITDASVSSHHAEIVLRGAEVLIKDNNSTNGTYINGEKISEAVLQPGQTLRFGQVELKLDDGKPMAASAPAAPAPAASAAASPKQVDTVNIPRGVSLTDLEQGGGNPPSLGDQKGFSKKTNQANRIFLIVGIMVGVLLIGLILFALKFAGGPAK